MTPSDFTQPLSLASGFHERDPATWYWLRDGRVYYRNTPLPKADPTTFKFYLGGFGHDANHCYSMGSRLAKADTTTFRAVSYAYYADCRHVWSCFGEVMKADAASFQAADTGAIWDLRTWLAFGFGKDRNCVYYVGLYGYNGWLPEADPASFVSFGDGHHGYDANQVYCGNKRLPKAHPRSWVRLGSFYSRDGERVYHLNHPIKGADAESFQVVAEVTTGQLARDRGRYYLGGVAITSAEFDEIFRTAVAADIAR